MKKIVSVFSLAALLVVTAFSPDLPIPTDGTVDVALKLPDGTERPGPMKDFTKYFDVDYLRSLLEN